MNFLDSLRNTINSLITDFISDLRQKYGNNHQIVDMIEYVMVNESKKLRSILIMIFAEIFNIHDISAIKNYILAIEILHTYTLIHDDLPALDNDDLRRGQPTAHKKFGEANAILLGDIMHTMVFDLLSEENPYFSHLQLLKIVNYMAKTGGIEGIIYGEFLDINHLQNDKNNLKMIKEIHIYKTAVFFEFCTSLCGILANSNGEIMEILKNIGLNYGIAFQLLDDYDDFGRTTKEEPNICNFLNKNEICKLYNEILDEIYKNIKNLEEKTNNSCENLKKFISKTLKKLEYN